MKDPNAGQETEVIEDVLDRTDEAYKMFEDDAVRRLLRDLRSQFIPLPDTACCGDMLFFYPPDYLHHCTVCGKVWKLVANAVELKQEEITEEIRQKIEDGDL